MSGRLPLEGIRVVALEQAVAGPFCTRNLADMGADVIKVERPDGGDFARRYDSVVKGESAYFVWLNRGKRSIALDLSRAEDRATLEALLGRADVFVHNLGPGAVERLGLGWDALHARWPRLISCSISGYGVDGPYRDRKAFDLLLQAESGVISVTGSQDAPAKVGISIADIAGGLYAFSAILLALRDRDGAAAPSLDGGAAEAVPGRSHAGSERYVGAGTGEGRFIDISLLECLAEWMMAPAYHQMYAGAAPPRAGMRHNMIVPYGPYRCGDGTFVTLGVQNEGQWERLCETALSRPQLARDPRFVTNELRLRHRAELEAIVEEILGSETRGSMEAKLTAADVPFGSLNSVADLVAHPQLAARARWREISSNAGPLRAILPPFNIVGVEPRLGELPRHGGHTDEIRRELAGHARVDPSGPGPASSTRPSSAHTGRETRP